MANNETFFQRLTRLFRSGPTIQRRIKGYDAKSYYDSKIMQGNYGYRAPAPFGFGRENSPFSVLGSYGILDRMSRYAEFSEMEYSLHPDTKIAIPGGYTTIKELADKCQENPEYNFIVYSFDHNKKEIVAAVGKQARKTCHEDAYKITFDNGTHIIGSFNHRLMKRDGTYCIIKDLKPGDAMMPFYRRSVATDRTEGREGFYQSIYTIDRKNNKYGWTAEHKLLAEMLLGRKLNKNEVVHHKNFKPHDNRIENLEVMTKEEHQRYHAEILNGRKWNYKINSEWIENFKKQHSEWMKKNNPAERKDIGFWKILEVCEQKGFNLKKVCHVFDTDPNTIKRKLRAHGYNTFISFAEAYCPEYNPNKTRNKPKKFDLQKTFSLYEKDDSLQSLARKLDVSSSGLLCSLQRKGYENFTDFKSRYNNLKVSKVEYYGKIDLYDLTVDGYKNFATDSVISHNTPELASALDIYADETVGGDDRGRSFHIYSDNIQVKRSLEELFYDVLNVEFNLRAWTRNLVKYGDFFLYNEVLPEIGIVNAQPIPVSEVEREEGYDEEDPYAVRFKWLTRGNVYMENWQVAHMRILGNDLFLPYGTAVLESARRIWRQLVMMEDAMLVYRVVRSPERRVFYIDVGNVSPNDVPSYMEAAKSTLRSHSVVEKNSGRMDMRYNPLAVDEDYYIPVRGSQSGTKIESLAGGQHVTATEDVQYIQSKMFAALKVPKPYLNFDENLSCLTGKTEIPLLSGETKTIEELVKNYNKNSKDFNQWVYTTKLDGAVVPGRIKKVWKTKEVNKIYRITLDNNKTIDCTENHPFLLREGIYKRADQLKTGTSLMPIYRKFSSKEKGQKLEGYEMIFDNKDQKWIYTHRMVKENVDIKVHKESVDREKVSVVHHVDVNKRNNNPNNLLYVGRKEHYKIHRELATNNLVCEENRDKLRKLWKDPDSDLRINHLEGVKNAWQGENGLKRREKIAKYNRKYNKIKIMQEALEDMRQKNEPSFKEVDAFIAQYTNKSLHFSDVVYYFKCSGPRLKKIISKGTNNKETWVSLKVKYNIKKAKQKKLSVKYIEDYAATVSRCRSVEKFCREIKVSRNAFYKFLKDNSINPQCWFKEHFSSSDHFYNHKIIDIQVIDLEKPIPVYDLEIENPEDTHNFLLEAGVVVHNSKATLAQEDIRFSRTISGIQKIIIAEMNKLAMIHLFAKGFDGEQLIDFELKLSNPSSIAVQQKLELWATKADVAGTLKETKLVDERWIQKNVLELTDDDVAGIEKGLYEDKIKEVQLDSVAFENEEDSQSTTDTFSPANYNMGGAEIVKDPDSVEDNHPQKTAIVGPEFNKNNPYKVNYNKGQTPIKATPFLTRNKKNRARRVGQGGRDNTSSPDFAAMLNPSTNRSLRDVFDSEFLKSPTKRESLERKNKLRLEPILPNDIKSIFNNMKDHFERSALKKNILTEEINLNKASEDPDEIIFNFVNEYTKTDKTETQPTSLKEVIEEFDNDIEITINEDEEIELE